MITFASLSFGSMIRWFSIAWQGMGAGVQEILAIFGGVALVTLLAVIWALYFRKRRRRRRSDRSSGQPAIAPKRRSRIRREHRRRNPTLAETGGLRPARVDRPASLNP
jgi:uncharacterized membrane protein